MHPGCLRWPCRLAPVLLMACGDGSSPGRPDAAPASDVVVDTDQHSAPDETGPSDPIAERISAVPLAVVLTWTTPGAPTPRETEVDLFRDGGGSDLDLHVVHERAACPVGDSGWTCNWLGCALRSLEPAAARPTFDLDDEDGEGPEILSFDREATTARWTVQVHSWDSRGHGSSSPRIQVFGFGAPLGEAQLEKLDDDEVWLAGTIEGSTFTPLHDDLGAPLIVQGGKGPIAMGVCPEPVEVDPEPNHPPRTPGGQLPPPN